MQVKSGRINLFTWSGAAFLLLFGNGHSLWSIPVPASESLTQASATAASSNRCVGTITATGTGFLTVKSDAGVERKVTVPDGIRLQRIAPGAKDLSNAAIITFSDLAVGDRVLVRIAPSSEDSPSGSAAVTAISIVAIPQADLAQKQQQDREDWQRNGVGGLVKSVSAGTGDIVIVSGAGALARTTTLHTTPTTVLRRYAENSVSFDQAKPAPIETIQIGDQLRARGTRNADGAEVAVVEVVSGSFRNIAGTITSINAAAQTIQLKDLTTKQNVTVHVGADVQMRKLPDTMARMLASMTKPAASGASGAATAHPPSAPATTPAPSSSDPGAGVGQGRRSGNGDLQQMLSHAPAIHLADLQKGDAVMLVSTQGTAEVTAVTLLAGVEPLLQAPASTQNMLLSNWNMSSGGGEAAQ